MNGKDKISVIIPCYNVQKYIMRCFDSIYSQTYGFENLEVILIDDLSTDNTWSILESLQRQYPENVISLKIQKKGKCGGARNLGMDICTGKYITFVDADDYVHPDMLRVLYDRMTEDDYDVAQCGVSCFKADKPNVLEVNDFEIQRLDLDNVDNRKNLIIGLTGFTNVTAWAKLYSTKFIIEHNLRFIEDVYYEDTHFSMLCVLLAKKYCKVQSTLYYYFENTEGIIRSEISNAKIRDAKIIMDHIRQAIQSRKAELGNVIEQCYCEIQTFLLWHQYIEPYSRIETFMNRELDICKEEFLKSEPDIFNNPYVKFFSDDVVLKRMSRLRVTAKKMDNAYFLDNAMHICLGIHDKDGNYSVWAGTTMQSIVENTKAPIVFHILHDDTLNEINKNKLSLIADNSGNDIEFHHFNSDVFGTFADSMNRFAIGTMFRIMLPDIMPDLKKIIYLDSDLFVNTDIEELWNLNIDNYCLAAAQDCSTIRNWGTPYAVAAGQTSRDRYFNAGVLCMNLDNIRKNGINLDIYGSGDDGYTIYLKNIVKDACADDYIHFKGRCNLEKIYPHYELFASFSLWETFGLSLMETVGDGLAMVGLDVRYGNRLFIHPDENGYLVDFDIETDFQNKDKLCERTAAAIVKIFEDDDRLKKFHENSYMIAEEYKEHVIESKWMQLIKNIP